MGGEVVMVKEVDVLSEVDYEGIVEGEGCFLNNGCVGRGCVCGSGGGGFLVYDVGFEFIVLGGEFERDVVIGVVLRGGDLVDEVCCLGEEDE